MRKHIVCLLSLLIVSKLFSQVNYQTGSATFSLPMFSWQDDKSHLNLNIALNYNSGSGLKVSDIASNVGQGWSLLSGGVITRMQAGEPDDQKPREGNGTVEDVTKYPAGYLYDNSALGCPNALTRYPIFGDKNHVYKQHNVVAADKEIDQFAFQINGRTGIFILNKDTTNTCVSLNDTKMKIWFEKNEGMVSQGIRTTIAAFYIQDENGLIYKFAQLELEKALKTKYCNSNLTAAYTQPNFKGGNVYHEASFDDNNYSDPANVPLVNPWVVNSWHLTQIKDPLTQRTITFNYVIRNINAPAGTAISYYKEKDYSIISHITSITQSPVIASINFPDGHQATFNYGDSRIDLNGDYALSSVDITYSGRYLSRYQLTTSYVMLNRYGTPSTRYQKSVARLYLLSVKRIGVDLAADEEPYLFDYYLGTGNADDIVPPAFCPLKDVWGYYNGNNSVDYNNQPISLTTSISDLNNTQLKGLCFLRSGSNTTTLNPKAGYAKNGLLKRIIYPTGGSLNYEYDQNQGLLNGQTAAVGGVHVSITKLADGGYSNDCNNPIVTNFNYVNSASTTSSLWGLESPQNSIVVYSHYSPERKYFYYRPLFSFGCDYSYKYPGILSRNQSISLTAQQQFMLVLSQVLNIVSGVMTIIDIVNVAVAATPAAIVAIVLDVIGSIINIAISCFSDPSKDNTSTVYYNSDLNGANPLPCQFKRVEVTGSSGGNGKTVMEFTSSDDYPLWFPSNPSYSKKQRFAFWAYGLPKKTTIYNASGDKVKETENKYDMTFASHIPGDNGYSHLPPAEIQSCKCVINKTSSQRITDWANLSSLSYATATTADQMVDIYDIYSGRTQLDSTYERIYKLGNPSQYQSTTTKYVYNSLYLPYIITTSLSDGSKTERVIKYSGEYQDYEIFNGDDVPPTQYSAGVLNKLNQNNIIDLPVESTSAIIKVSGEYLYLNEHVSEFTETNTGDVKPYRNLEQRFNSPQPILKQVPGGGWVQNFNTYILPNHPDNPSYKETQNFSYDASGNLIGMKDEGGRTITNIYDYNDKYVIASVINADATTDKSAYTSFETTTLGGWTLNGTATYSTASSITGNRSLSLAAANSLTASLNTAKPYKLSFWASSSITISSGATLIKSAPVRNGFTYYEYDISQGTSTVTITGTAAIDELRLAPPNARMRTVTYDPLIGKTSECDENNRITYYEYDKRGRLQFVKDDQKNIVKMYEYNTAKNLQTCPITYYNNAISEVFTKNDCSAGYTGSDITYVVPAGKYSSTTGQADADQQAETELLATGQNYANAHGSCIQVFYSVAKSTSFTKDGCDVGYIGTSVTYNVPAGKYSSTISQADADQQAQDEIDANGQSYANVPGVTSCIADTTPVWQGEGDPQLRCQTNSYGNYTGHQEVLVTNINPNSATYNQTKWQDIGANNDACPPYVCSGSNCHGADKKCINNHCETGLKIVTGSQRFGTQYRCIYHYQWSDGTRSVDILGPLGSAPCPI